ncbi:hypothetical protein FRC01_013193, partial [Tulasnella sp. 417]
MKRKIIDLLNGGEENQSGGDERNHPEQKRSKVSRRPVTSVSGISLDQIRLPDHVKADGGAETTVLVTTGSNNGCAGSEQELRVAARRFRHKDATVDRDTFFNASTAELKLLLQLSHPNISKIAGFEEHPQTDTIWVFSLWESNGNLSEFLVTGKWNVLERMSLIKDLLAGLKYLHTYEPPICHGNVKSRNVLVNSSSRAIVADFASSRILRQPNRVERRHVVGEASVIKPLSLTTECSNSPRLNVSYCGTRLSLATLGDY